MKSPFILENETEYKSWRQTKLELYPLNINKFSIPLDINNFQKKDLDLIKFNMNKYNFALYNFKSELTNNELENFCTMLNLNNSISNLFSDSNNISDIKDHKDTNNNQMGEYIPYTNKPLNWHTDGYYYPLNNSVKSFLLHCVNPAHRGGENLLLDHEILYILIRDHNPSYIKILMENNIMGIPRNKNNAESTNINGPVFFIDDEYSLNMRFTSRQQNIVWKKSDIIDKIKKFIFNFVESDTKYITKILLKKNQGYIANNILHKREKFFDNKNKRLLKRIRFSKKLK